MFIWGMYKMKDEDFKQHKENSFWEEGEFIESVSPEELEKKKKSIDLKPDEDVNYNCKKCEKKIGLHNKDWHNGMCDECFNETYFGKK